MEKVVSNNSSLEINTTREMHVNSIHEYNNVVEKIARLLED